MEMGLDGTQKRLAGGGNRCLIEKGGWAVAVRGILRAPASARSARVVKLVDTGDLKSPDR